MRFQAVLCLVFTSITAQEWWRTAVFYQIYPRSFKDSDNNGVGDLKGVTSKLDYLADIGVSAVWLSPFYKSPFADFGYDISNYTEVDSLFGTIDDLKELIAKSQEKGIKVILDFVPNHSSNQHPWFNASVYRQGDYAEYYVWRDQNGTDTQGNPILPNNWLSNISGNAWEWNDVRKQFYLHQFTVEQPDLNYRNAKVVQEMQDAMNYWLDLGIDGFRLDALKFMVEDDQFQNEPVINTNESVTYNNLDHIYTTNQNLTFDIIKGWNEMIKQRNAKDGKERVLLLEVYNTIEETMRYYGGSEYPFSIVFNFHLLTGVKQGMTALDLLDNVNDWLKAMPSSGVPNWVVGNHDNNRIASRAGPEFADAVNMILAMLPGIMVTYNGDELGMTDTFIRFDETVDPNGKWLGPDGYLTASRDPERSPMQWDDTENAGFCLNAKPWLPVNPNYWRLNVDAQKATPKSHLNVYKSLTKLRQSKTFLSASTAYDISAPDNYTFVIRRWSDDGFTYVLIANLASEEVSTVYSLTNVTQMTVAVASTNAKYSAGDKVKLSDGVVLRPKAAVILTSSSTTTLSASIVLLCFSIYTFLFV